MTTAASPPVKLCVNCGKDITHELRLKAKSGQYWCMPCGQQAREKAAAAAPPAGALAPIPLVPSAANTAAVQGPTNSILARRLDLLSPVTCAHCWKAFPPEQTLWVARHPELIGDTVLGPEQPQRFLPSRFTSQGQARDAHGMVCQHLACPHCHLILPRELLQISPFFLSIVGGPATGKSYLLAAMTWQLRQILPSQFGVAFSDINTDFNRILNDSEATLFLPDDPNTPAAIRKTELQGEGYHQVAMGGQVAYLPQPFLFSMRPQTRHPLAQQGHAQRRVLCLYDNAGEHFQPGMDTAGLPGTEHLAQSRALLFLFDPTQDPRFRERCRGISNDPQLTRSRTQRQETLLLEAGQRIRRMTNRTDHQKIDRPLLVLVSKSDVWAPLLKLDVSTEPFIANAYGELSALEVDRVERTSDAVKQLLSSWIPELVAAAEDFSEHVLYIPVSALGCAPQIMPESGALAVRPADIKPRWVTVPLLYMFAKWTQSGLVRWGRVVPGEQSTPAAPPRNN